MESEVNIQYILLMMLLTVHSKGNVEIMECGMGNAIEKKEPTVDCLRPQDVGEFAPANRSCHLVGCSPKEAPPWKVVDSKLGKIQVSLFDVAENCGFDNYEVNLEVHAGDEHSIAPSVCDVGSPAWKTHSVRFVSKGNCSRCGDSDISECAKLYTLTFKYVYPGWYRMKVTPYTSDGSTRQSQISYRFQVDGEVSKYAKKRLVDLNINISLQYRDSARQLDVGVSLLVDNPPEVVELQVNYSPENIDLYEITRYESGSAANMTCRFGEHLSKPTCKATSELIDCSFWNMTEGSYGIVVTFEDDRCTMNTVWTESVLGPQDPCRWDIRREYNVEPAPPETYAPDSGGEVLYSTVALSVLLFALLAAFFVKRRLSPRRRHVSSDSGSQQNQNCNFSGQQPKFNFGQLLTLSERPRPEVLLLYSRDSPPYMELVASFRRVLDKICKCKIYDCFDPDMWGDISQDPERWIHTLIVERRAKVVIVASEVAVIRHRSLMGGKPEWTFKSPHPFDDLFTYALKILRDDADVNSYKNHFVVTFDGFTESKYVLDYFNPYTRFILPKHLNKLFEHLHDSDSTVHFDTSSRLEERYEVRQLRLRLEHLITLKLLPHTDAEKQKLLDW